MRSWSQIRMIKSSHRKHLCCRWKKLLLSWLRNQKLTNQNWLPWFRRSFQSIPLQFQCGFSDSEWFFSYATRWCESRWSPSGSDAGGIPDGNAYSRTLNRIEYLGRDKYLRNNLECWPEITWDQPDHGAGRFFEEASTQHKLHLCNIGSPFLLNGSTSLKVTDEQEAKESR